MSSWKGLRVWMIIGALVALPLMPDKPKGTGQIQEVSSGGESRAQRGRGATSLIFHTKFIEEFRRDTYWDDEARGRRSFLALGAPAVSSGTLDSGHRSELDSENAWWHVSYALSSMREATVNPVPKPGQGLLGERLKREWIPHPRHNAVVDIVRVGQYNLTHPCRQSVIISTHKKGRN